MFRTAIPAVFAWFFGASGVLVAHARIGAASAWLAGFTALLTRTQIIAAVFAHCGRRGHRARALEFD